MRVSASIPLISLLLSLVVLPAHAARFSDVSSSTRFAAKIEALAQAEVVHGNPDNTFAPAGKVNRAAMLVMLYRARGLDPSVPKNGCGRDVVRHSWYEPAVCDAIAKGYVKGYDGGLFKPDQPVNRAEALKMTFAVLEIPYGTLGESAYAPSVLLDVKEGDWFMPYVSGALAIGMVPLEGEAALKMFMPGSALLRGEAASFIYDALSYNGWRPQKQASSAAASQVTQQQQSRASTGTAASAAAATTIKTVDFPFSDDGTFSGKTSMVYRFPLKSRVTAEFLSSVLSGKLTCRLFKLKDDGTSEEYYLGDQQETKCVLRVTLEPGSYQLDLKPTESNAAFTVTSKTVTGDGNDGFAEAKVLQPGKPKSGNMPVEDMSDWYSFTLAAKGTHTIHLTNIGYFRCIVYPTGGIDLFGFVGPECNIPYDYPAGKYVIGVIRENTTDERDYSIWLE